MLVKFEQNRMVKTTQNYELFDKKTGVFNPLLTKLSHQFGSHSWNLLCKCLTINFQTSIFNIVFQKLRQSDMCKQIKSCVKHGRPD